jgi:transposase-like protein
MARRSKLTAEFVKKAGKLLENGNYANTVCAMMGISQQTWYRWLKEAEESSATAIKREFSETVKKATALAEIEYVNVIKKAAGKNWQAAGWWLERKFPEKWGRRDRVKMEHEITGGVMVVGEAKQDTKAWEQLAKRQQAISDNGR